MAEFNNNTFEKKFRLSTINGHIIIDIYRLSVNLDNIQRVQWKTASSLRIIFRLKKSENLFFFQICTSSNYFKFCKYSYVDEKKYVKSYVDLSYRFVFCTSH